MSKQSNKSTLTSSSKLKTQLRPVSYVLGSLLVLAGMYGLLQTMESSGTGRFERVAAGAGDHAVPGHKEGGFAWGDLNQDGYLDLVINTSDPSLGTRILISSGGENPTFFDQTEQYCQHCANDVRELSALLVDLNQDGYLDLVRNTAYRGILIYLNQGPEGNFQLGKGDLHEPHRVLDAKTFHDGQLNAEGVFAADYNGDGWLDLVVENHDLGIDVFANPKDGTAHFVCLDPNQLRLPVIASEGDYGTGVDLDDDGDVDLLVRKGDGPDLYLNQGNGTFEAGQELGAALDRDKGGVVCTDFDHDGDLDLYWTDAGANQIWLNDGEGKLLPTATDGNGEPWASAGLVAPEQGIDGCAVADVNHDGRVDLFLTANDGPGYLFLNQTPPHGALQFMRDNRGIAVAADGEGAAFADYDRDGDLDLYLNVNGAANQLWRNDLNDENYLFVAPRIDLGNRLHRAALGANVVLRDCAGEVIGGIRPVPTTAGHGTGAPGVVHFGLPDGPDQLYTIEVRFVAVDGTRRVVQRNVVPSELPHHKVTIFDTDPSTPENCGDHDQDGIPDHQDLDDDNDGLADRDEQDCSNGPCVERDTDGDGIPDQRDLDSDNDGIVDLIEAGGHDSNGDGQVDQMQPSQTFAVSLTVTDDDGCTATHTGTVTVGQDGQATFDPAGTTGNNCRKGCPGYRWQTREGQLVIEAENYDQHDQQRDEQGWLVQSSRSGFTGAGYVGTLDGGTPSTIFSQGARLTYQAYFDQPGKYQVWARVIAPDEAANSAYVAVGQQASSSVFNGETSQDWQWVSFGTVAVRESGQQPVSLVRRENGLLVDKLVFSQAANPPTGPGPAETLCEVSDEIGQTFTWQETFDREQPVTGEDGEKAWTLSYQGKGNLGVKGREFEMKNVQRGGAAEAVWRSKVIDISALERVEVSVEARSDGRLDAQQDYLRLYYRLDGGKEVPIAKLSGNFNEDQAQTFSVSDLEGSRLQVIVKGRNNASSKRYYFDDVRIQGAVAGNGGGQAPLAKIAVLDQIDTRVTFSGQGSTDPDGRIAAYYWQWGDGNTATGPDASHVYLLSQLQDRNQNGWSDTYDQGRNALPLPDSDGDGIPDHLDLDSDNDGIPDLVEAGGLDSDGDGRVDDFRDEDFDGLHDFYDGKDHLFTVQNNASFTTSANDPLILTSPDQNQNGRVDGEETYLRGDTDQDGYLNTVDLDSDHDGVADLIEAKGLDVDGDGRLDSRSGTGRLLADRDQDGFDDAHDADLNNDGDTQDQGDSGQPLIISQATISLNGRPDRYPHRDHDLNLETPAWALDQDNDKLPDFLDVDDDGDGLSTVIEAFGPQADADHNAHTDGTDGNGNGWADDCEGLITASPDQSTSEYRSNTQPDLASQGKHFDFDQDGLPNFLDLDSDNDGIVDLIEAQPTAGYFAPSGKDLDRNGLDDQFQRDVGHYLAPYNLDNDAEPDYLDLDSDHDGLPDLIEGHDSNGDGVVDRNDRPRAGRGEPTGEDRDLDGLDDGFDNDRQAVDPTNRGTLPHQLPKARGGPDQDWRSSAELATPLQWLGVEATWQEGQALLTWHTQAEENSDFFAVERSLDGVNFTAVGRVASQGDVAADTLHYEFVDASAASHAQKKVVYYRLHQVDRDHHNNYSARVELLPEEDPHFNLLLFPNPASDFFHLRYTIPQEGRVRILNQVGAVIFEQPLREGKGEQIRLSLPNMSTGVYYVSLKAGEYQQSQMLIVR